MLVLSLPESIRQNANITTCFVFTDGVRVDFLLKFGLNRNKISWVESPERFEVMKYGVVFVWKLDVMLLRVLPPMYPCFYQYYQGNSQDSSTDQTSKPFGGILLYRR